MKKILFTILILLQNPAFALIHETPNLETCLERASEATTGLAPKDALYVFDIDNTVLSLNQNIGSVQWFRWQKDLIQKGIEENRVADSIDDLLMKQGMIYQLSKAHSPEATTAMELKRLQLAGHPILYHTSRNIDVRDITERDLKSNDLFPLIRTIGRINGFAGVMTFENGPTNQRPVSFQRGIYMSVGQDKGVWLQLLLEKVKSYPKHLIFVDDELKNLQNVERAFEKTLPTTLCRYGKVDGVVDEFNRSDKSKEIQVWQALQAVLTQLE